MFKFISLRTIKEGKLDEALEKLGYIRATKMAERWGMTSDALNRKFSKGYTCDCFKINNVRYISVNAVKPE